MVKQHNQQLIRLPDDICIDRQEDIKAAFYAAGRGDMVAKDKWKTIKSQAKSVAMQHAKQE
jgi:hypothetical protein